MWLTSPANIGYMRSLTGSNTVMPKIKLQGSEVNAVMEFVNIYQV